MGVGGDEQGRLIAYGDTGCEASLVPEVPLEAFRIRVAVGGGTEQDGELAIELDQPTRDRLPLVGVGAQDLGAGRAAQHGAQLPAQVPRVGHRDVHALAGLGAVGVAGIARDEHPRRAGVAPLLGNVVESVAQPLADPVDSPPADMLHVDAVRAQDAVGHLDELRRRHGSLAQQLTVALAVELDVEADEMAALTWDDEDAAVFGGDRRLEPDVGEVGDRQHVEHAPRRVRRVPVQRAADGATGAAARPVASHDVAGPDGRDPARGLEILDVLEVDGDRVVVSRVGVRCARSTRGRPDRDARTSSR